MTTEPIENSETASRYVVGIDLGTTNSAVAFVDTSAERWQVETFGVPQLVAPGVVEARETLPSFHYQRAEGEFAAGALRLQWSKEDSGYAVGVFARDQGAIVPGRLIASAKSWLCHSGVDRLADLLPWHGAPDVDRLSPVEVSRRYLAHIRAAWNHRFPREPLEVQEVVLTLPASFDEVARELTVKAAAAAGLPRVVLIEEPQAAIYQWINAHREDWEQLVQPGQKILICDIGGGTSDFTLIRVDRDGQGKTQFHRVAVGEHLILGGDNLDLALAHHVEQKLVGGGKLEPRQWSVLVQRSRQVKEALLGDQPPERLTLSLPGSGSRLIGGGLQVELARDEVQRLLVDGFFPLVPLDEKPVARRSGFQEFGLPYAADSAITRYLAAFLTAHRFVALPPGAARPTDHDPARPDVVLFNGGVFDAPLLRDRLLDVICSWFPTGRQIWQPQALENERRDLAVARGAAHYGMVRRGQGVRIAAGLARSYFIGATTADDAPSAVCILPAGIEEGQSIELTDREFHLLIRQPVEFPLYVSSTQLTARAGDIAAIDPERMTALPPIRTVLQSGKKTGAADHVAVHLHVRLTEIGTLELWCSEIAGPRTWRLQFDVRAATRTDLAGHEGLGERAGIVDLALLDACRQLIRQTFGSASDAERLKPESLVKRLAEVTEIPRSAWPPSLMREMWEALMEVEAGRKRSPAHEARWLSLLGFALRPGYGMAVDDWRVAQTRRLLGSLAYNNPTSRAEWWILWRRIAGGLPAGQQRALAQPPIAEIRNAHRALAKGRGLESRSGSHEAAELWRMLGSLELLSIPDKIDLGNTLLDIAPREKVSTVESAAIWALGRIGQRVPMYGPLNTVVPADIVIQWAERLMKLPKEVETIPLALMQMARKTGDRYRDVPDSLRSKVLDWFNVRQVPPHFIQLVADGGQLEEAEQSLVFGESLPQGLRLL
ncbi:MAG TPA: Hsp70 family protein [Pirellulales bacterium]|jgi:molecular chaperone DnaK (HSP70)|nr:Hsp70 family protein [Pirellulales bacterium]